MKHYMMQRQTKRLVLLFALTLTLLYLRFPPKAHAANCYQTCFLVEQTCLRNCPAEDFGCQEACVNAFDACIAKC